MATTEPLSSCFCVFVRPNRSLSLCKDPVVVWSDTGQGHPPASYRASYSLTGVLWVSEYMNH